MKSLLIILFTFGVILTVSAQRMGTLKGQINWSPPDSNFTAEKGNIPYSGIPLEIYVHQITHKAEVDLENGLIHKIYTPMVGRFFCKWNGTFKTRLPPGQYSVFVRYKNAYFGNLVDNNGNLSPAFIDESKRTTWITITLDYE